MTDDVIYALTTGGGHTPVSVIRISGGPGIFSLLSHLDRPLKPGNAVHCRLRTHEKTGEIIDDLIAIWFKAPNSFTGEEIIELQVHGSPVIRRAVYRLLESLRFRLAERGEFSKRSWLNGKIDLIQAEALNNLILSKTDSARRQSFANLQKRFSSRILDVKRILLSVCSYLEASLDYPEEEDAELAQEKKTTLDEIRLARTRIDKLLENERFGRRINDGFSVAIIGPTNAGKSSLFNYLVSEERALVSEEHGTTRDYLSADIEISSVPVVLYDTAGLRETNSTVERMGMERTADIAANADLLLLVIQRSELDQLSVESIIGFVQKQEEAVETIVVVNKCDDATPLNADELKKAAACAAGIAGRKADYDSVPDIVGVSVLNSLNLEHLLAVLEQKIGGASADSAELPFVQSEREKLALTGIVDSLIAAESAILAGNNLDEAAHLMKIAMESIYTLTGESLLSALYDTMFSRFCLGK